MALTELRTPRLHLRAWRDSDREPFAAINADPRVMRWFPSTQDRAASDETVDRSIRLHEERGFTSWAVEVLDSERFTLLRGLDFFSGFGDVELWEVVHRAQWQRHRRTGWRAGCRRT